MKKKTQLKKIQIRTLIHVFFWRGGERDRKRKAVHFKKSTVVSLFCLRPPSQSIHPPASLHSRLTVSFLNYFFVYSRPPVSFFRLNIIYIYINTELVNIHTERSNVCLSQFPTYTSFWKSTLKVAFSFSFFFFALYTHVHFGHHLRRNNQKKNSIHKTSIQLRTF